jgi:hypothetical protein
MKSGLKTTVRRPAAQRSEMIALRLEPRLRYLTEVAARAKGLTLSAYLELALQESFKSVTLRVQPESEPLYGDDPSKATMPGKPNEEEESTANIAMSVANLAELLWSESEFERLQSRAILAPHTLPKEDEELLRYLHGRDDLKIRKSPPFYKFNRVRINNEWDAIRVAFLKAKANQNPNTRKV